jgi:fatty acid amide hydrolase
MLTAAGATQVAWEPPALARATDLLFACLSADRGRAFKRLLHGNRRDPHLAQLLLTMKVPYALRGAVGAGLAALGQRRAAVTLSRLGSGNTDDYWQAVEAMADFRRDLLRSLDRADGGPIDLIVCPAYPLPAVRHGANVLMPMPGAYAPLANVTGFPAGIVPVTRVRPDEESDRAANFDLVDRIARKTERGSAGLPVTVQVIARPWRDHVALAAMAAIERAAKTRPDYPARAPL